MGKPIDSLKKKSRKKGAVDGRVVGDALSRRRKAACCLLPDGKSVLVHGGLGDDGSDEEWTPTCTDMVSVSCF